MVRKDNLNSAGRLWPNLYYSLTVKCDDLCFKIKSQSWLILP